MLEAGPSNPRAGVRAMEAAELDVILSDPGYASVKAALDLVLAGILLILTSPLLLAAAILVKLTSRGPVIYSQKRLGQAGRIFTIYKIRSMARDCEKHTGPRWSTPRDPRVTPVGKLLRSTHLDELPQLWNVLRGDMSLVGPRPERPEIAAQLVKVLPGYLERLKVRPGLTGLAQVQLPPDTDIESVRLKLIHDLYYVERLSFWFDFQLLLATVPRMFNAPFAFARIFLGIPGREQVELLRAADPPRSAMIAACEPDPYPEPPAPCELGPSLKGSEITPTLADVEVAGI